jgi:predicted RNA-binding protein YlqC (UPF0109 family)
MAIQDEMKKFTEDLVKNLVDKKDEVQVEVSVSTKSILIQIKTAKQDTGKIIGRKGRSIEALKVIALAVKNTKFPGDPKGVSVEILEDETSNFKYSKKE